LKNLFFIPDFFVVWIYFFHQFINISSECPKPELLSPCTCSSDNINCGGDTFINIKHIFDELSQQLLDGKKNFSQFYLNNTAITEIEENTFYDITFVAIVIEKATKLTKINSYAFSETNYFTNTFYIIDTPVQNDPPTHNIFFMLSLMRNVATIQLLNNNISTIPSYAFKPINGFQSKLLTLNLFNNLKLEQIENYAFYNLDSLTQLQIYNSSIEYLPANALNFRKDSKNLLNIYLDPILFNGSILENNAFLNTRRPTVLNSQCLKLPCKLTYLDEKEFSRFLDLNDNNKISLSNHQIDCTDCRSYWLRKNEKYIQRIVSLTCIDGKQFMDNSNFINCE
jgi:hypothetical protein